MQEFEAGCCLSGFAEADLGWFVAFFFAVKVAGLTKLNLHNLPARTIFEVFGIHPEVFELLMSCLLSYSCWGTL